MKRDDMQRIDAALDGSISRDDFARLQQAMRHDPAVLRHYRQQASIHGQLEWELQEAAPTDFLANRLPRRSHWILRTAAAAAILMIGAGVVWLANRPAHPDPPIAAVPKPAPVVSVAALAVSEDASWDVGAAPDGTRVLPGIYSLSSGSATLVFDGGATIALKSPARIQIAGNDRAALLKGKATIWIPDQAAGFLLETPTASLSDQNTRFAVAVNDRGHTELHVLEGVLELIPKFGDFKPILVRTDRPVAVEAESMIEVAGPFNRIEFPELPDRSSAVKPGFVHWSFDRAVSSALSDTRFADTGIKTNGGRAFPAIVQTKRLNSAVALVPGKFGNAVQLNGQGGFIRTDLPGVPGQQPRTVAFWVRIPPGTPSENSYSMISWGTKTLGGKWQINWNAGYEKKGVVGAIRTEVEGGYSIGSTDLRDGRWHHVASVFLGGRDARPETHILHYVDGRLESTSATRSVVVDTLADGDQALPIVIGRRLEGDTAGTFKGLIDELYLFSEALTPGQIEDLYLENRIESRR